jgi:putative Holliday junction resolvase
VQDTETINTPEISPNSPGPDNFLDLSRVPAHGRILSLDIGTKRVGAATCDEFRVTVRGLLIIKRKSWKELLLTVKALIVELDAVALVLGLPLNLDGTESEKSADARRLAKNFSLSLDVPVFLQDERLTSVAAEENLRDAGLNDKERKEKLDSEAAALILQDFLSM